MKSENLKRRGNLGGETKVSEGDLAKKRKMLAAQLGELTLDIGVMSEELRQKQLQAREVAIALKKIRTNSG